MEKTRFSKTTVLNRLYTMSDAIKNKNDFDNGNGWAQLRLAVNRHKEDDLIESAVEYGRWRALQTIADIIENGDI